MAPIFEETDGIFVIVVFFFSNNFLFIYFLKSL